MLWVVATLVPAREGPLFLVGKLEESGSLAYLDVDFPAEDWLALHLVHGALGVFLGLKLHECVSIWHERDLPYPLHLPGFSMGTSHLITLPCLEKASWMSSLMTLKSRFLM